MIKIEKVEANQTYYKSTKTHLYKVNDKEVRVYEHSLYDELSGQEEYDWDTDVDDLKNLRDEEREVFDEEYMDMDDGDEIEVEGWEDKE